ncbi:hypothetical protein LAB1_28740 [Roseibium sp. LAB1]
MRRQRKGRRRVNRRWSQHLRSSPGNKFRQAVFKVRRVPRFLRFPFPLRPVQYHLRQWGRRPFCPTGKS